MKAKKCKECAHWNAGGLLPEEWPCDKEHQPRHFAGDGYKRRCGDFSEKTGVKVCQEKENAH